MALIAFGSVKEDLRRISWLHTAKVLVRDYKYLASGNSPELLILTDKCLYHGGTGRTGGRFNRIRHGDVFSVEESGRFMWRSIHVKYRDGGRKKSIFLCPFEGRPQMPRIDEESFDRLVRLFKGLMKNERLIEDT